MDRNTPEFQGAVEIVRSVRRTADEGPAVTEKNPGEIRNFVLGPDPKRRTLESFIGPPKRDPVKPVDAEPGFLDKPLKLG